MTQRDQRVEEIEAKVQGAESHSRPSFVIATTDAAHLLAELRKAQDKLKRVEKLIESPFASADKRHYEDDFNRGHVAGYNAAAHLLRAAVADATGGERKPMHINMRRSAVTNRYITSEKRGERG